MTSRNLILEIPFPNTWNIFCIFEVMNKAIFLKSICLEIDLSGKVSPKFMSANAESARFKLAYNIHAWAYFEFLGKKLFLYLIGLWSLEGYFMYQLSWSHILLWYGPTSFL